jgi:hypothetical protein
MKTIIIYSHRRQGSLILRNTNEVIEMTKGIAFAPVRIFTYI